MEERKKVVIVQEHIPHYRVKFYNLLREQLDARGVDLDLYYSPLNSIAAIPGGVPWAKTVKTRKLWKFVWQPVFRAVRRADVVILAQESKYVLNYLLFAYAAVSKLKLALWGHGRNFQSADVSSLRERLKCYFSRRVDWWFAYTERSKNVIEDMGFDGQRITTVKNSIDTKSIQQFKNQTKEDDLDRVKVELGIDSENVAIFVGRFLPMKRTEFLIRACELVRERVPDFHVILIGKGPEQNLVKKAELKHAWIHPVGVKDDREKVPYWMISKLLLMPGALGLVVLDSFVFGVPMVTTSVGGHGPEITYLDNGRNGVVTEDDPDDVRAYADKVVDLMSSKSQLTEMSRQCLQDAELYSIEEMVDRFVDGVESVVKI
tara:strand:- start:2150 stop:3274 length:1125 start_codon:yes stop_codon:yes gene_type:complete